MGNIGGRMAGANSRCIFCKREKLEIVDETPEAILVEDITPATNHHYLAIPKVHLGNCKYLNRSHADLVKSLKKMATDYCQKNIANFDPQQFRLGFHWAPFNTIEHLHMHVLYPVNGLSYIGGTLVYRPGSKWFCEVDDAIAFLEKQIPPPQAN